MICRYLVYPTPWYLSPVNNKHHMISHDYYMITFLGTTPPARSTIHGNICGIHYIITRQMLITLWASLSDVHGLASGIRDTVERMYDQIWNIFKNLTSVGASLTRYYIKHNLHVPPFWYIHHIAPCCLLQTLCSYHTGVGTSQTPEIAQLTISHITC